MTDVDILSSPEWASLLESLQLRKPIREIQIQDVVRKLMDFIDKWESFYKIYAQWMGFRI